MSKSENRKKRSVPSTIMLKSDPHQTLTQMVSPTPKKASLKEDNATRYMVSRKATTFKHTKMRRIVRNAQPTMTQTFSPAYKPISVKNEPFDLTQLSCDYPTSPSASVIDLLSHASEDISEDQPSHASDDISEDLLPEGTLTQAMGSPIIDLGPYSSSTSHTQLAMKSEKKHLPTSMISNTFEYGANWNDANPGDLVMATASEIGHPAYKSGTIGCSYILLGAVVEFVYLDWDTGNIDENWDGIVRQHERIRVRWLDVGGKSDDDWDVTPAVTQ